MKPVMPAKAGIQVDPNCISAAKTGFPFSRE